MECTSFSPDSVEGDETGILWLRQAIKLLYDWTE